ncbi:hypothetical protein D2V17_11785 [Aurantiacibacter xanthus]|uniref:Uncharacterized protein n=1 Tax=Aurantiacibacter xanthus TaxID=1784712 RepID=A0A3A1P2T1_9SPHN|nr:hypothetical protein D2V17_11785 [Aurantiacibacter xanthus]
MTLALAACGEGGPVPGKSNPATPASTPTPTSPFLWSSDDPAPPPGYTDGSGINEHYPDLTPVPLAMDLEHTEAGARNVLLLFARAIELREYDQAWDMLDDSAKQRWSKAAFNTLFDGLSDITVSVPGGEMEGAAGSSYYTSEAEITATDANGRPIRMEGALVLRRVNDVPGASEEQLRWHVAQIDLTQTH